LEHPNGRKPHVSRIQCAPKTWIVIKPEELDVETVYAEIAWLIPIARVIRFATIKFASLQFWAQRMPLAVITMSAVRCIFAKLASALKLGRASIPEIVTAKWGLIVFEECAAIVSLQIIARRLLLVIKIIAFSDNANPCRSSDFRLVLIVAPTGIATLSQSAKLKIYARRVLVPGCANRQVAPQAVVKKFPLLV
jgi:hypothetical protein